MSKYGANKWPVSKTIPEVLRHYYYWAYENKSPREANDWLDEFYIATPAYLLGANRDSRGRFKPQRKG